MGPRRPASDRRTGGMARSLNRRFRSSDDLHDGDRPEHYERQGGPARPFASSPTGEPIL